MTYYSGTKPEPHPSGLSRCRIRNRPGLGILLPPADAQRLAPFDLFMTKAGTIIAQGITGKRHSLPPPYQFDSRLTYVNGR